MEKDWRERGRRFCAFKREWTDPEGGTHGRMEREREREREREKERDAHVRSQLCAVFGRVWREGGRGRRGRLRGY